MRSTSVMAFSAGGAALSISAAVPTPMSTWGDARFRRYSATKCRFGHLQMNRQLKRSTSQS
ncbi:hypothetical protein G5C51_29290 [Streptomyces sp. A7024]|uniref:Secreted protein n=1 Tax=Streptomyces coryli TaxID=1128680 RepID=A0A6G4U9W5_9ACTN|nr:hypothetical protein [Streptomyces coryli]NGN67981.1 hypothetical protein [Streptomyces coryli]